MAIVKYETGSDLSEHPYDALKRINGGKGPLRHKLRIPTSNQLFLDYDWTGAYDQMIERLGRLSKNGIDYDIVDDYPSKTPGHRHVIVELTWQHNRQPVELDDTMRIALQATLGSDPVREMLSALRVLYDMDRPPTVLFEPIERETPSEENDDDIPF